MSRPEVFVTFDRYKHDLANLDYQRKYALEQVISIIDRIPLDACILESLKHLKWSLSVPADQLLFSPFPAECESIKKEVR